MKVSVVGAGIGGLTAALCLRKSGHDVTVYERSGQFAEVGAGLQCGANANHVFSYLGLSDEIAAVSVDPERAVFRDHKSGQALHSFDLGEAYRQEYGAPYLHIHRADLHKILADELLKQDSDSVVFNAQVSGFDESERSVSLGLKDGRSFSCDCLIAADGIRSVVREQLIGDYSPQFTGNVAWRLVVPTENLPHDWMAKEVSNFVGPNKHAVLYYLRNQELANLVGVVENKNWTRDSWVENSPWEDLKRDFVGWHPTVQAIIDAADKQQCFRWALYKHTPFQNWSSKRVTLLGDAAHATLPFMASGAAMAIEDARILQRALDQANDLTAGLQLYQRNRMGRTATIQDNSAKLGKIYHLQNRWLLRAAFKGISLLGGRQQAYLPSYNANTVNLR